MGSSSSSDYYCGYCSRFHGESRYGSSLHWDGYSRCKREREDDAAAEARVAAAAATARQRESEAAARIEAARQRAAQDAERERQAAANRAAVAAHEAYLRNLAAQEAVNRAIKAEADRKKSAYEHIQSVQIKPIRIKEIQLNLPDVVKKDKLEVKGKLGEGAFAQVFEVVHNNAIAVVKVLTPSGEAGSTATLGMRNNEASFLKKLTSCYPSVPKYISPCDWDGKYGIMMSKAEGANLFDLCCLRQVPMSKSDTISITRQICLVLQFCQNSVPPLVNGDIKSANLLFSNGKVCIVDWGTALVSDGTMYPGKMGTPQWMAPEVSLETDCCYTTAVDMYSLGILTLELLTGNLPYGYDMEPEVVLHQKRKGLLPDMTSIDGELAPLIAKCLKTNPAERPTATEFLAYLNTLN